MTDALREAFELYFADSRRGRGAGRAPTFARMADGTYADDPTQRHWWTWQNACRPALAAPAVPVAWHCPNDPDSATAFYWRRPNNGACPNCGRKLLPVVLAAAPTAQQEPKP